MNRDNARATLAFQFIPEAGPVLFRRCLEKFGSVAELFSAPASAFADVERIPRAFGEAWSARKELLARADRELDLAEKKNIEVLTILDEVYPELLRQIYDPPAVLFYRGALAANDKRVAVVGSRETSAYGDETARVFGRELARAGVTVVSGLARGIDSRAHQGVLEARGVTWAVLGGGLLHGGSYRNPKLANEIVDGGGAIFSEFPLHEAPRPEFYPRRNRIVSGLCAGIVVIEAGPQSGALITAGLALEQGRDVFAVPANVDSSFSQGSNWLLRQGAKAAFSAADVLEDLGWTGAGDAAARLTFESLSEDERRMAGALSPKKPLHLDEWIEKSGRGSAEALALIGSLVLKGAVAEKPGKYYAIGKR